MEKNENYADDIRTIKRIMEESSRFISLSGFSGLFAGLIAIAGGCFAQFIILQMDPGRMKLFLFLDALIVLFLALAAAFYFSFRTARRKNQKIWTPVSRRMLLSLAIPLLSGVFFIVVFYLDGQWQYIIPAMLIFYGLSLVSAGKFTYSEVFYLGLAQIMTGFAASVFNGSSLYFWMFGFGLLHLVYGLVMYRKYKE
jgi:hypothetical protein